MRNIEFTPRSFNEFQEWLHTDKKIAIKIAELIRDILRDPFNGIGKLSH
jgi:toxin YoeB